MKGDPLMDTDKAAEYVRRSKGAMANERTQRIGAEYMKLGKRIFYRQSALDKYMKSRLVRCHAA